MSERRWSLGEALAHIRLSIPDEAEAFRALREALERAEFQAVAATWGPPDPMEARAMQHFRVALLAETWAETTELVSADKSEIRFPKSWFDLSKGFDHAHAVHVPREAIERLWPLSKSVKSQGGRPAEYDWHKYLIEASAFLYEHGTKQPKEAVYRYLQEKLGGAGGGPSRAQMQTNIDPLIRRLQQLDRS